MGVHRALIDDVRRRVTAEAAPPEVQEPGRLSAEPPEVQSGVQSAVADGAADLADRAFGLLAAGLGEYARKGGTA